MRLDRDSLRERPSIGPDLPVMVNAPVGAPVGLSNFTDNELREEIEAIEDALRWLIQNPLASDDRTRLIQRLEAAKAELDKRNTPGT
jgi:hypothetical protein